MVKYIGKNLVEDFCFYKRGSGEFCKYEILLRKLKQS